MSSFEQPKENLPPVEQIGFCKLHNAGHGRLILTIPKDVFGAQASRLRDVLSRKLYPALHDECQLVAIFSISWQYTPHYVCR